MADCGKTEVFLSEFERMLRHINGYKTDMDLFFCGIQHTVQAWSDAHPFYSIIEQEENND